MRLGVVGFAVGCTGVLAGALTWSIAACWAAPPVEGATLASVAFVPIWTALTLGLLARVRGRDAREGAARRRLVALHFELGGALALAAIVVFGSGVGALLDRSLGAWQTTQPAREVPSWAEQPLDRVLASLVEDNPHLRRGELSLRPARPEQPWIQADFRAAEGGWNRVDFDPDTGAAIARDRPPLWVARELHRRLLLPPWLGESLLGLLGLALALVLLSGLATRRRWLRSALRKSKARAPLVMRLHQWIGVGMLTPALFWAWSGALLGLTMIVVPIVERAAYSGDRAGLMRDVLAVERPPVVDEVAALPDLRALAISGCPRVDEHLAGATIDRVIVRHPGLASASVRVDVEGEGLRSRGSFTRTSTGALLDCRALAAAGPGLQTFTLAFVLHFGEWGPRAWVELASALLGLAMVALAWLGALVLIRRRERSGALEAARRLRRGLLGVGLGLSLALTSSLLLSRLPSLARAEDLALALFVSTWALALVLALGGELERRRATLLQIQAVLVLALPVVGWLVADVRPGGFEALCVLLGVLALRLAAQPTRPREAAKEHPQAEPEHHDREERTDAAP